MSIAVAAIFVLCTWVCYLVAKKREAKVSFWVVMGILLGPFAIPFVFFSRQVQGNSNAA